MDFRGNFGGWVYFGDDRETKSSSRSRDISQHTHTVIVCIVHIENARSQWMGGVVLFMRNAVCTTSNRRDTIWIDGNLHLWQFWVRWNKTINSAKYIPQTRDNIWWCMYGIDVIDGCYGIEYQHCLTNNVNKDRLLFNFSYIFLK